MNDFLEIENELRSLRPVKPSERLMQSVAGALDAPPGAVSVADTIIRPNQFRLGWLSLGLGLAAAAAVLLLLRIDFPMAPSGVSSVARTSPNPAASARLASAQFIPEGATRVVFDTRDEGLHFPRGASAPVRRLRSRGRETLQWHNSGTGASLRVSYPSEEVQFIPVSGQ